MQRALYLFLGIFMGIIFGLLAALCWGAADFLARYTTRIIGTYRTLYFMQFFGLLGLGIYLALSGTLARLISSNHWQVWVWALLAALLNVISSLALYRAFEVGVMSVVSPIAASSAALTVGLSFLSGETISRFQGIGIGAALLGVVLAATSFAPSSGTHQTSFLTGTKPTSRLTSGVSWALAASLGYGIQFWLLGFYVTPSLGGITPVWLIRLTTICTLALFTVPARQSLKLPGGTVWWLIASVGVLDTCAFVAAALGLSTGQVAIVSVLASLFSTITVVLSWIFLRERLFWNQWLGICIIFVAIVLINV